jgi:hypothetical protein
MILNKGQVLFAIPLLVTKFFAVKALCICSWSSLGLLVWLGHYILCLALLLLRFILLLKVGFVLDRHHMAAAAIVFLYVTLYYF